MISAIVPVFRNAPTLRELTSRLSSALEEPFEIVFVDDASPDDSAAVLASLAGDRVRVVRHERNRGQNAAVLTGFAHARGDVFVVLDADLQDPPEAIPALLRAKRESGAAVAFGARTGSYAARGRMLTSRLYKRVLSWITRVPHGAGLFVALDRTVAEQLRGLAPMPSVVAGLGVLHVKMIAIPIVRAPREESAYSGFGRLRLACRTLAWVLSHR